MYVYIHTKNRKCSQTTSKRDYVYIQIHFATYTDLAVNLIK